MTPEKQAECLRLWKQDLAAMRNNTYIPPEQMLHPDMLKLRRQITRNVQLRVMKRLSQRMISLTEIAEIWGISRSRVTQIFQGL